MRPGPVWRIIVVAAAFCMWLDQPAPSAGEAEPAAPAAEQQGVPTSDPGASDLRDLVLLLDRKLEARDLDLVRERLKAGALEARALAATILYKNDPRTYEKDVREVFAIHDFAARSKGEYNMVTADEIAQAFDKIRRPTAGGGDQRLALLHAFAQHRDRNEWIATNGPRVSVARLLRGAYLAVALKGTGIDTDLLANEIDQTTRKTDLVSPASFRIHQKPGWAIAVPEDWRQFSLPGGRALHFQGGATRGVPSHDGNLNLLQVGLSVDVLPAGGKSLKEHADEMVKAAKGGTVGKLRAEPVVKKIALSDGTEAILLETVLDKPKEGPAGRVAHYVHVICFAGDGSLLRASGFAVGGWGSAAFLEKSGLVDFLRVHVTSLVLDPAKVSKGALATAYAANNWQLPFALAMTYEGNKLMEMHSWKEAVAVFNKALGMCDAVPAAHNGLAWALLKAENASQRDPKRALVHARIATDLAERRSPEGLDTLALALFENGDREAAMKAIQEAIALAPGNVELRERLRSFEQSGAKGARP